MKIVESAKTNELNMSNRAPENYIKSLYQDHGQQSLYGACSQCSCPGYQGSSGYDCTRGGCGHHYDVHGS